MDTDTSTLPSDRGDTGPTSFSDPALKWSDEPSGDTSPTSSPPATDEQAAPQASQASQAATDSPAETARDGAQSTEPGQTNGPIPWERHQEVLNRQRAEADNRMQRVAWAEELTRAGKTEGQIREALTMYDRIAADPVGFLDRFYEEASKDPRLAPQVKSFAGKVLGARAQPGADDDEPQPDLINADTREPAWSPAQARKWQEWNQRRFQAQLDSRVGPIERERERIAREQEVLEAAQGVYADAHKATTAEIDEVMKLPGTKESLQEIKKYLKDTADPEGNYTKSITQAYLAVVLPKIAPTERAKTLAELTTKAAAGTGINPRAAAAAASGPITKFDDPRLKW